MAMELNVYECVKIAILFFLKICSQCDMPASLPHNTPLCVRKQIRTPLTMPLIKIGAQLKPDYTNPLLHIILLLKFLTNLGNLLDPYRLHLLQLVLLGSSILDQYKQYCKFLARE